MLVDFFRKTYHRNILENLLKKNVSLISGDILDIGSKNRRYDHLFRGNITAIDIVPNKEKRVVFGNIEKGLKFADGTFDSIISLEVFEYLDNQKMAIKEIYRLLKPEGKAIISVPFICGDHKDNKRFTEGYLKREFKNFSSVKITKIGNGYIVIWDIVRKKIKAIKSRPIRYLFFLLFSPYLLFLRLFRLEKIKDNFYSGIFLILKK